MLKLGSAYRLLSAVTHGHHWAVRQLGFRQTEIVGDMNGLAVRYFEKNLHLVGIAYLAPLVAKALTLAQATQFDYFGWSKAELTSLSGAVAAKLIVEPPS
jgi:hypothetical protein